MNIWAKVGLTALALIGGSKLFAATRAKKVSDQLNVNLLNPRIHKVDPNPFGGGIELRMEVQLQNPTNGSMEITQPYMQLISSGVVLSSTKTSSKKFRLKPMSQLTLDTISFKLSWTTIISQLTAINYNMPENQSLLQKASWIVSNHRQILNQLNLAVQYKTYANGLFYTAINKINV